ncbi:MAG: RNase adapter RapZ [Xanthomonadales bacterium]|nr:RNase adapter RapZ [Xanthomonadales bacterium]
MTDASPAPAAANRNAGFQTRLVILTGLSGAGKTVALRALEDLDFYCVDNLPVALIPDLLASARSGQGAYPRVAVGVDARNRPEDLTELPRIIASLARGGVDVQLVFLDASDDILIKRYSDSRRRHPLAQHQRSLADAIARERQLLRPLLAIADLIVDTGQTNVHQLRRQISIEVGRHGQSLILLLQSFAFKRGVPGDADFVFDTRCLPNPHWVPELRPLSGRDEEIGEYFLGQPQVGSYIDAVIGLMDDFLPRFEADDRAYLTIAVGCTGGRHRSVYTIERLAAHFRASGRDNVLVFHRELS